MSQPSPFRHLLRLLTDKPAPAAVLPVVLLFLTAFLLFSNTFGHEWTYDDVPVILQNDDVKSFSAFWKNTHPGRPLRELSYLVDHALFGMSPAGWHIQNIFWHGLNGVLLFFLASGMTRSRWIGGISSVLFLCHPLVVEVVANISHRKDSLLLACVLAAVLAYRTGLVCRGKGRFAWLCVSLAMTILAFFAKQSAIVLPFFLAAYEVAEVPREDRLLARHPRVLSILAIVTIALGFVYFTPGQEDFFRRAQSLLAKMNYFDPPDIAAYLLMLLKSWTFLFSKVVWPVDLGIEYAYSIPRSWVDPWVIAGLLLPLCAGAGLFVLFRKERTAFFFLAFTVLFFIPVSNIYPLAYFSADRYLYAPLAAMSVLLAILIVRVIRSVPLRLATCGLLLTILSVLTCQQNRVWQSQYTLWSQAYAASPDSTYAQNNLAVYLYRRGETERAIDLFRQASKNPLYPEAQNNLAEIYEWMGQKELADYYRRRAKNPHAVISSGRRR